MPRYRDPPRPRGIARPVVCQFVIVHGDQPRKGGVRAPQCRVGFVPRVVHSVAVQIAGFVPQPRFDRGATPAPYDRIFVEVVAQVHDQVQTLPGHMVVGRVVPVVPGLAGRESEAQAAGRIAGRRCRPGAADRGDRVAGPEAVEIPARRFQTADLGVHRMTQRAIGDHRAAVDHPAEPFVVCDLVVDGHRFAMHPARPVRRAGIGRRPGPQHYSVRCGIPRGNAQGERITR